MAGLLDEPYIGYPQLARRRAVPNTDVETSKGLLRGISYYPYDLLGAPIDLINMALTPLGMGSKTPVMGSDYLQGLAQRAGLSLPKTDSSSENIGRILSSIINPAAGARAVGKVIDPAMQAAAPVGRAVGEQAYRMTEDMLRSQGLMPSITAYHGTPHNIQGGFDISKIGTGEGAQAYGRGMYYAENPAVATEYQKRLSGKTTFGERPSDSAYVNAVESFREANYPLEQIPAEMKKAYKSITDKDIQLAIQATEKGNLYKVDIPDQYVPNMLDWDKPLNQQTKEVQEGLAKLGIKTDTKKLNEFDDALLNALKGDASNPLPKQPINPTGEDIYKTFVQGNPQLTSQKLNEVGIKGIRYADEGSRNWRILTPDESVSGKWTVGKWPGGGKEQKYFDNEKDAKEYFNQNYTSNFVVFEPKDVKILEKNSQKVESLLD
jgi:hypothetical protein